MQPKIEKTPATMRGGKHFFQRYFFTNEYANQMKCARCGIEINSVFSEEDAIKAIAESGGNPHECIKVPIVVW